MVRVLEYAAERDAEHVGDPECHTVGARREHRSIADDGDWPIVTAGKRASLAHYRSTSGGLGFPHSVETSPMRRWAMTQSRRKFDEDFKQGAVRLVRETGKPIAQVARELGINEGTLGNWCAQDRRRHGEGALAESEREELRRLRKENAELRMRCDVLKRSAALWVEEAMRR
jgi:transposase